MELREQAEQIVEGGRTDLPTLAALVAGLRTGNEDTSITPMLIAVARRALYDGWEPDHRTDLAALLSANQLFGYARRLLRRVRADGPDSEALRQQHALCTYKDLELPAAPRLDNALEILGGEESLKASTDAETLGFAGAIYKRKWEVEAKREDLERSLSHYERGFEQVGDRGFTGINAAYVSDLIADLESKGFGASSRGDELRKKAETIRRTLIAELGASDEPWDNATVGEAYFGLGSFDEAWQRLTRFREQTPSLWQLETAVMQLARLARLHGFSEDDTARVLRCLVDDEEGAIRRALIGKVGLALSGGGFRASFFHIGVLARLADCDLLRHIEVLSCVSGGSILGAFYYLNLRRLLQERADADITQEHYQTLVLDTANEFFDAVRGNLRVRLTADFGANLRMLSSRYSRTDRAAHLFEQMLYSTLRARKDPPWRMSDLFITPAKRGPGFSLRHENWLRSAKVPMLVLNATTLNTGHDWQFTASWMGEPPSPFAEPLDASSRLRRVYYTDAPGEHRAQSLARAVAASACVPGLFPPVELRNLYEDIDVELVDGGVHDNQGIASLLEQDCTIMLVSDASGQIHDSDDPSRFLLGVTKRSNMVLMGRVREAQYRELLSRRRSETLRGLMFVHLKKGLKAEPRDWIGCQEAYVGEDDILAASGRDTLVDYGIDESVQRALSEIRTDLDRFSEDEARSLMAAGYAMARREIGEAIPGACAAEGSEDAIARWPFAATLDRLALSNAEDGKLSSELRSGRARFFRGVVAWRDRHSERPGALKRLLDTSAGKRLSAGARTVGTNGVLRPIRTVVGLPVAAIGALGTRIALIRRR